MKNELSRFAALIYGGNITDLILNFLAHKIKGSCQRFGNSAGKFF